MPTSKTKWVDLTEEFTPEGLAQLKTGKLIVFDFEGSKNKFRVVRVTSQPKIWAIPVETYTGEEAEQKAYEIQENLNRAAKRRMRKK